MKPIRKIDASNLVSKVGTAMLFWEEVMWRVSPEIDDLKQYTITTNGLLTPFTFCSSVGGGWQVVVVGGMGRGEGWVFWRCRKLRSFLGFFANVDLRTYAVNLSHPFDIQSFGTFRNLVWARHRTAVKETRPFNALAFVVRLFDRLTKTCRQY